MQQRFRLTAWAVGVLGVPTGIALMVASDGTVVGALGAFVAALSSLVLFGAIRCGRFEIEIGRQWLRTGTGPLRRRVPREMIADCVVRPATGWRRLYAEREVVVELVAKDLGRQFPTREPAEVLRCLGFSTIKEAGTQPPPRDDA